MAQAATPEGPGLPCSPKQALALYRLLFRCPAGLGQFQAALQQVHEGRGCLPGLELPIVLLEMERSRRARERLLWDLELLTGLGLGLFWPPWAQVYGQRDQTQHTWSQYRRDSEQLMLPCGPGLPEPLQNSSLHSPHQAEDVPGQNYQLLEGGQARDSSASELSEARSDADPRRESPTVPPGAAPGCFQELDLTTASNFKDSGHSELKGEQRSQAELTIQRTEGPTSRSPQGRKLTQEAPQTSGLASHSLPTPQDPAKSLGSGMGTETQTLLVTDPPQVQQEKTPQDQSGQWPQEHRRKTPQAEDKGAPRSPRENSLKCHREEMKTPPFWEDNTPQALEVVQGQVTTQRPEDSNLPGHPRGSHRSPGKQMPQPGEPGRPTQPTQHLAAVLKLGAAQESPSEPLPAPRPSGQLGCPAGGMQVVPGPGASEPPELLDALPGRSPSPVGQELKEDGPTGALGEQRRDPGSRKAAWPAPGSGEEASRDSALQRLLELHGSARRRRRRDREQQRLRILERLRIAGNRHRRVHPLGLPLSTAQLPCQEDEAGKRHALRERLQQVHLQRTRRLRALVARNTQNFQELLLSPGAEEPAPGD